MTKYGLTLSSEEHSPSKLVEIAVAAEESNFDFVSISDHFHPWIGEQGHSPFVWSVLGAISARTERIGVGVGVSCPIFRMNPAVSAQAAATTASLLGDRFTWGVGTGEALNEHITAERWPPAPVRLDMLREALEIIRELWSGESITYRGEHFTLEDARLFDLPDAPTPILVAAFGDEAAKLAAELGDGLWTTGVGKDVVAAYREAGGHGPVWSQLTLCWAESEAEAVEQAHRVWPNTALPGQLAQDLRTVLHFEQAVQVVRPEDIAASMACGPDPAPILESIRQTRDAGADHIYLHHVGDPLEGFIDFWSDQLRPSL